MFFEFEGKKISGVISILPENSYTFEEEALDPKDVKNRRLKRIIGFGERRRCKGDTTLSEMLVYGMKHLIKTGKIKKEEIGAIVVSTLSQDYFLPQISTIIHGELELANDVFCIDSPQACGGYVVGLVESFLLLDHMKDKKVILCTGEIFNRKTDPNEPKFEEPSFGGDIANISIIENSDIKNRIVASSYTDGVNRNALLIRDGGFKYPMTPEKIKMQRRANPFIGVEMDGSGVFNFVQKEIPRAIDEILSRANVSKDDIDYYLFHQPNKFMLQKLAEKIGVPFSKMPMDLTEKLGNSDSGTIPAIMTTDIAETLMNESHMCCFSGFGGGLTWTSVVMNVEPLEFCENLESPY